MRYPTIKILAVLTILSFSCMGCRAGNSSSPASEPKVKTTKKAPKTTHSTAKPQTLSNSQLQVIEVRSEKMGRSISNLVVLPEQYLNDSTATFAVVYLLHGYSDNFMAWQNHVDLTKHANKRGFIIVCPDGQDSWYFDSPIDPTFQFETYVTQELRSYVESHYRTINDREHRAITGLSMGGHGALWLAWRHPDIYGMCGSMSGGVDITTIKDHYKIDKRLGKYAANEALWKSHSVMNLVPTLKNDQFIIIDDGTSDIFIKDNRALHAALQQHKIKHDYRERPGRHSWDYWTKSLENHLTAFFCHIQMVEMGDC